MGIVVYCGRVMGGINSTKQPSRTGDRGEAKERGETRLCGGAVEILAPPCVSVRSRRWGWARRARTKEFGENGDGGLRTVGGTRQ